MSLISALIQSARHTFQRIDEFVDEVQQYLDTIAEQQNFIQFADEIRTLQIQSISYMYTRQA